MRFHEVRQFTVPGINFSEAVSGTDPVTGRPLGTEPPKGIIDKISSLFKKSEPTNKPQTGVTNSAFQKKLREIADKLGVEAAHLMKIMRFETMGSMNPGTYKNSNAVGLIQFLPIAAKGLGTTTQQLASMSAVEQLDYVYKFYKMNKLPPGSSLSDIYLYTYMPAALQTGQSDDFVLGMKGAYGRKIWDVDLGRNWDSNPSFAREATRNKRTYFTVGDVRNVINRA